MDYYIFTLSNGLRVIHRQTDSPVSHCGISINAGTRDEDINEQGMAHFIEHMLFKGTTKRKAYHILSRLDDVGGDLNAYTSKEDIVLYASFLNKHYERTLELFSDIIFNSTYPDNEIEKEKDVVLDEINSYKDSPSDLIFDDFEELIFPNHPIGRNILGTIKSVKAFKREDILNFIEKNFNTNEIVISSVGNIDNKKFTALINKHFGHIPKNIRKHNRKPFISYSPINKTIKLDTHQTHCIIGNTGYNFTDKNKTRLILLNNILGGPAMNSRLNLSIREKYGFAYNIESNYSAYTDTGIWQIYFSTDKEYVEKTFNLIYKELNKLINNKLGTIQLKKAKEQLIGQIAVAQSLHVSEMLSIGKTLLVYNRIDSIDEIIEKINEITSEDIQEIAKDIFKKEKLSTLIYEAK